MKLFTNSREFKLCLILLMSSLGVFAQQITHQFTFTTTQVEILQDSIYNIITLEKSGIWESEDYAGKPQLPVVFFNLLLPKGATATNVSIAVGQQVQLPGSINVYPSQLPAYPNFSDPPPFTPQDPTIYSSNTPFPSAQLIEFETHGYRDYNYARIAFTPFKYLPLSKQLFLLTQLTFNVSYSINNPGSDQKLRDYNAIDETAFNTIKESVVNGGDAQNYYSDIVAKINNSNISGTITGVEFATSQFPSLEGNDVLYVIITNNTDTSGQSVGNLISKFQEFADWKTQNGTPAKIVTVDEIRAEYPGFDIQEKIRNFIKEAHRLWGTEYVLLGGGSDIIPSRSVFHSFQMSTDLYYSAIYHPSLGYNDSWNANGNNIFGQNTNNNAVPDYADYTPDIAIGRAPVDSESDVENFIKKNFTYGRSSLAQTIPSSTWLGKTLLGYGAFDDYNHFNSTGLQVGYDIIQAHHNNTDIYGMMEYSINRDRGCNDPGTWAPAYYDLYNLCSTNYVDIDDEDLLHDGVITQINQGYNIINIVDHAGPYGLGLSQTTNQTPSLVATDFQNLIDTHKYGILLAGGCHTAPIERDFYIGEQWVNSIGGGVAFYGTAADIYISSSKAFNREFFNTLFTDNVYKLGWLHSINAINSTTNFTYLAKIYQNLGDPDLSIYTSVPSSMSVTHANSIALGNQDFDVNVSGFPSGEMVRVSLYKEDEVLAYIESDNFPVTFDITPDTIGQLQITATCHNTEPYEASIPVTQLSGAHLYKSDITLIDENSNGIIEPGEDINLGFEISNTGTIGATGISALLTTTDSNTIISQPTSLYPNIPSNQSRESNTSYTFTASTEDYPGDVIPFLLTITSDQGVFYEPFLLNIESSILELGDRQVLVQGTETNVFSVGDEIDLFLNIKNLGSIMAEDVNAVLTTNLNSNIAAIIDGTYFYGDISSSLEVTNTDPFDITVGPNYNGEALLFDLTLTDVYGKTEVFEVDLTETPPVLITGFDYTSTHNEINSFWNVVPNIQGYNIYRSDTENGLFEKQNDFLLTTAAAYNDVNVEPLTTYWYKISVVSLSGNELELNNLIAYPASTKLKRHGGFPIQTYPGAAKDAFASPIVFDIDGNGEEEIFLDFGNAWQSSIGKGRIMAFYASGQELFNVDGNETEVWGFAETSLALHSNPAIGDVDNDGHAEVFAIGRDNDTNSGELYAYHTIDTNSDNNPDPLWSTPVSIGHRAYRNPILADLNNDGFMEMIVLDEQQRVLIYNKNKTLLGAKQITGGDYALGELAVADIDQDGYKEIIIGCKSQTNLKGAIFIWNHNGNFSIAPTILKEFDSGEKADNGLILADIDNDGKYEVLTITRKEISNQQADGRIYAINIENGTAVNSNWNGNTLISLPTGNYQSTIIPRIAVGDLDKDGNLEIVFGSRNFLYILDSQGTPLQNYPLAITNVADSSPILADIDEDDEIEIIVNTDGIIKAFNIDGSECQGWSLEADNHSFFVGSPSISDIDNDGMNEMVANSKDYTTYVWDTTGDADKVEWGSYRENAQNTAVYKEKCTFSSAQSVQINSGSIVSWNTDRHIQGNLVVKPNANLSISSKITFPRNSKLIIEPGAKLTINGGILTTECGSLWKGIRVQGNYNLTQTPTNQATLVMVNNAVIEHAEIGVYVGTDPSITTINNGAGGLIEINGANFRDNVVGIEMPSYPYTTNSYIQNSIFENTEYLTDREEFPTANILVWKVKPITIENNTFRNLQQIEPYTNTQDLPIQGNGIVGTDAKLDILNNQFENLNSAIKLEATGSSFSATYINISENTFEKNWNAVSLNSIDGVEITSNAIDVFDTFLDGQGVDGSSGLYIVNSNGFHIEDNNIYSSSAEGLTTGIFIRDCQAVNEIYRNQFTDLDTGVFAMGQNIKASSGLPDFSQGLQLICNEFNDNGTDIYTAPLTRIANYQGTATISAGNTFLPECSGSTNEFNNQGYQVNYRGETGGIYLPDCNYNVNVFSNSGHNSCESTLGRPYGATDISDSEMEVQQNHFQYLANTDGGDTEALNESIEETESNEALELRNQLLEVSPYLSDTIIVKTTTVEDILPAIMVKDILVANPKAAKSDKIQLALDNRQELLPIYMRTEIDLGKTIFSQKEVLEANLSRSLHKKENILNRIMLSLKRDSLVSSIDSLETMLVSEAPKNLNRNYQLVDFYLSKEETQTAQTIYNDIPQNFQLNSKEQEEYDKLGDLLDIQLTIIDEGKSLFEMSNEQLTTLTALALDSTTVAGMKSRAILSLVNGTDYGLPIPAKVEGYNREATPTESEEGTLKVFPAVADKYFIVEYSLASDETIENTIIKIVDNENNEIKQTRITSRENQILLECEKWQEGFYWAVKSVSGKIVDKQRVIIDRGHLPMNIDKKGSLTQENHFSVFPNPAQDYFFVITNYDNESSLQATNSLGQVVGNYLITEKEVKISTSSWAKGVYYLNLTNGSFSNTVKIIIR